MRGPRVWHSRDDRNEAHTEQVARLNLRLAPLGERRRLGEESTQTR